jgi:Ser-tRNA(Ala) deacylase AlaX
MEFKSQKLYHQLPRVTAAPTQWERRGPNLIAIETSIAYAEAGGQLADRGVISQNGKKVTFLDTQKAGLGRCIIRQDFPILHADQEIQLRLAEDLGPEWDELRPIDVQIDVPNRAALSRSHTAAHLLFIAAQQKFGELAGRVKGCRIESDKGRFDLIIQKTDPNTLSELAAVVHQWVEADYAIQLRFLPDEPECRHWLANGIRIPCGGTHLESTRPVGRVSISRRSKGPHLERLAYQLHDPLPPEVVAYYDSALQNEPNQAS